MSIEELGPTATSTVEMYDQIPDVYSDLFSNFRSCAPDIARAHQAAGIPFGESRVVEIGCGSGLQAFNDFVPVAGEYTGYDPSEGLLEIARGRFAKSPAGRRPDFRVGYAQTTEYDEMDIAVAINSVLHVPSKDMPSALESVSTKMTPGGVLHIVTKEEPKYNVAVYRDDFMASDGQRVTGERVFYHYDRDLLVGLAQTAGFGVAYEDHSPEPDKHWKWMTLGLRRS